MKSDIKRQMESATGRISGKAPRTVNLPFSEAELLVGLDAHGAHADALALPSAVEMDE
jgi:antitoxin MazE